MKSLKEVLDICNANGEEGLDSLMQLMEPKDEREEMSSLYEETLGYDPITYYDIKDIEKMIDDVSSESIRNMINDHKDEIIEVTLEARRNSLIYDFGDAVSTVLGINEFKIGDIAFTSMDQDEELDSAEDEDDNETE